MVQDIIGFLSDTSKVCIISGIIFMFFGFVHKVGGFLEISPKFKKFTFPVGFLLFMVGLLLPYSGNTFSSPTSTRANNSLIQKSNTFDRETGIYNVNYTKVKKGTLSVTSSWKKEWRGYLTIYESYMTLPTYKGFRVLKSPNSNDISEVRNEASAEVVGYIKTNNGVFYVTKYSYKYPYKASFIEVIK